MIDVQQTARTHPIVVTQQKDKIIQVETLATGPAGKSAYQSAVEGGFVGDEIEFIRCLGTMRSAAVYPADTRFDFPNVGKELVIYLDRQANKAYRWDPDQVGYYVIGSDYQDIQTIDGGNANG